MKGIVIKSTGSWFGVLSENGEVINCKLRGSFRLQEIGSTNPIAVGDHVEFETSEDGTGVITAISDRKNYIIRKSKNLSRQTHILAANIDRAFLIATLVHPKTSMGFIDRFLATAEAYSIPASVIFNKSDLYNSEAKKFLDELKSVYEPLGYPCHLVSALKEEDTEIIRLLVKSGVNLFSGHSGVGKSSLINRLSPALKLKTAAISKQHLKGMHTTTFAEMHKIPDGGFIIDTPGIREFGIVDFKPQEVGHYFPEIRSLMNQCRFDNCTHFEEPGCAVKTAVGKKEIHEWRYYNYLSILNNEDNY